MGVVFPIGSSPKSRIGFAVDAFGQHTDEHCSRSPEGKLAVEEVWITLVVLDWQPSLAYRGFGAVEATPEEALPSVLRWSQSAVAKVVEFSDRQGWP